MADVQPAAEVTVRLTVLAPAPAYVYVGFCSMEAPVDGGASPNAHCHAVMLLAAAILDADEKLAALPKHTPVGAVITAIGLAKTLSYNLLIDFIHPLLLVAINVTVWLVA
jgi:hypothetical protein